MFNEIAENKDDYTKFYESFGKNLKPASTRRAKPRQDCRLARYSSTKSGREQTSLKDYVTRMKEGQKDITTSPANPRRLSKLSVRREAKKRLRSSLHD